MGSKLETSVHYDMGDILKIRIDHEGREIGKVFVVRAEEAAEVFGLWVDPGYRGLGLAKRLVDSAIVAMHGLPVKLLTAHVDPSNKASDRVFKSRGFAPTCTEAHMELRLDG